MAHLLAPQASNPELPVFFNVDHAVGTMPATNLREDVLLVQFLLTVMAKNPPPGRSPQFQAALGEVRFSGVADDATKNAIRAAQEEAKRFQPQTVVDGRVSSAKGYSFGQSSNWIIVHLNESVQESNLSIWPRIDQIPGCPEEIKKLVVRTVQGI